MKILFVTNGFPPQRWAGTETYTAGIAKELKACGHQVQVLCAGDWEVGPKLINGISTDRFQGVNVFRINSNWTKAPDPFLYLYNNPEVANYFKDFIRDQKPDLIHVTSCETLSASVLKVAKASGIPLVLTLTDFWFLCPRINLLRSDGENCSGTTTAWDCIKCQLLQSKFYRWPRRFFPEHTTAQILMGISQYPFFSRRRGLRGYAGDMEGRKKFLAEALTIPDVRLAASPFVRAIFRENFSSLPISILPYGHDLSWNHPEVPKTSLNHLRIGFIGQILPSKGLHLLIDAVKRLDPSRQKKVECFIYGNMDLNSEYTHRIMERAQNRENIHFCGTYRHENTAEVFSKVDLLVVPSIWYDFPLIIYEAFATHTPVIATNLAGMAESVEDDVNGFLIERGDSSKLASLLEDMIDHPEMISRLRKGIKKVFPMQAHIEQLQQVYTDLRNNYKVAESRIRSRSL